MDFEQQVKDAIVAALTEAQTKQFNLPETATKVFMNVAPFIPGMTAGGPPPEPYSNLDITGESSVYMGTQKAID